MIVIVLPVVQEINKVLKEKKKSSVTAIGFQSELERSMNHDESTNMATLMMVQYVKTEIKDTITN